MLLSIVERTLLRELAAMRRSVEAYPDDASVWAERPGLPNAGGTLVLHIAGNLQHYLGHLLGGSDYRRDRAAEFARRDVTRDAMLADLHAATEAVQRAFALLTDETLVTPFPESVAGRTLPTGDVLVHLATHLAYHLGQLDYHRRIVTGDTRGVAAVSPSVLAVDVDSSGAMTAR